DSCAALLLLASPFAGRPFLRRNYVPCTKPESRNRSALLTIAAEQQITLPVGLSAQPRACRRMPPASEHAPTRPGRLSSTLPPATGPVSRPAPPAKAAHPESARCARKSAAFVPLPPAPARHHGATDSSPPTKPGRLRRPVDWKCA